MDSIGSLVITVLCLLLLMCNTIQCIMILKSNVENNNSSIAITRADFPPGFVFGTASSAYQVPIRKKRWSCFHWVYMLNSISHILSYELI